MHYFNQLLYPSYETGLLLLCISEKYFVWNVKKKLSKLELSVLVLLFSVRYMRFISHMYVQTWHWKVVTIINLYKCTCILHLCSMVLLMSSVIMFMGFLHHKFALCLVPGKTGTYKRFEKKVFLFLWNCNCNYILRRIVKISIANREAHPNKFCKEQKEIDRGGESFVEEERWKFNRKSTIVLYDVSKSTYLAIFLLSPYESLMLLFYIQSRCFGE